VTDQKSLHRQQFFGIFTALGQEKKIGRFFSGNISSSSFVMRDFVRNLFTSRVSVTRD
jgi:hypothetical protein